MIRFIVGNKCDVDKLERQVEFKLGRDFSEAKGYKFYETSALSNNESVIDVFNQLSELLLSVYSQDDLSPSF